MTYGTEQVRKLETLIIAKMGGLPALGGDEPNPRIIFTEAELNSVAFCVAFVKSLLTESKSPRLLPHYRRGIESVISKLEGQK